MFVTLVLLVLGAAIVVFFSEEFAGLIKKAAHVPGVKLFVPLFIASWLVVSFEYWLWRALFYLHQFIAFDVDLLMKLLPFQWGAEKTAQIINLALMTLAPVLLFAWLYKRRHHRPFAYMGLLLIIFFIVFAMAMLLV